MVRAGPFIRAVSVGSIPIWPKIKSQDFLLFSTKPKDIGLKKPFFSKISRFYDVEYRG